MTQPQNPNTDPLLARIDKNPTGADLIQVVNTAGGQGIVYRINQFQAIWYVGSGDPTFIPGELPTNLYLDNLTGHIWQLGFNFVWTLLPSGGGGGGSTVQTLSTTQGTITGAFDGVNNMFTLSTAPDTPTDLMVFLNGIYQVQGTDYTLAGSIVTLTVTPDVGGELVAIINISTESLIDTLSSTDGTITGTFNGINTVFNLVISPSATINTALFLNGIYQIQGTDYTMSSSTITMTIPPILGDQLTAIISSSGSSGGGVVSLNGLLGVVNLVAGANTTITTSGQNITISSSGSGGGGVSSFNSLSGAVTETAGTGISLTTVGNNIQINNTGVRSINSLTGTPSVTAGTGINVTPSGSSIQVSNTGITSLNSETGAVNITAGANITVTPSGSNIQISSTGASGVASINGLTGTPSITPGSGVSVNVSGSSIQVSALTTPWLDIQNFGGKPRIFFNSQATTTLTSGSGGSPNIGIAASNGFVNGDGIVIWEAGNATSQATPASFPTASPKCVVGSQSIKYAVVGVDTLGGLTAISSTTTVTTAPAVFGNLAVVISSISASGGTVTANFASPINAVTNQTIHIVGVTGLGVTWNGVWIVASAPTASQVTFAVSGATGTGTVSGTSTGRLSNVQPITAISRSAAGVITITTAQNHNYVAAPTSQNAAVVIVENVQPNDLNGQYVMATASGTTITCNSGQFVAESGSITAGSSTATAYEYIYVQAPAYSTGNDAFYIYSDSYSPGSALQLIGKTMPGERGWKDYGPTLMQGYVAPVYVPTSPPGSPQLQMFGSTVVSGGGTTSLVLANPVPNPSGGLVVMHDDAQAMIAAFAAASAQPDNFGTLNMSPPQSIIEFPQYILNYPVTVPLNFNILQSCCIQINESLRFAGSNNMSSPFGSNRNTSPQFSVGNYATLLGNASPLVYVTGNEVDIEGIGFFVGGSLTNTLNDHNGQYGIIVKGGKVNFKKGFFGCGPSSTAIPLIYNAPGNGGCAWYGLEDVQFSGSSVFGNNHVPGQSSLLPPLPLMWVHWSDGNSGTGPASIQMYGNNSFSGRGILLDALNYSTNSTFGYEFGTTGTIEFQSPCTPSLMCWGAIFHGVYMGNWLNDSQQGPILANWNSVYLSNVTIESCTTSGNQSIVTGNLIQTLYFDGELTPTVTSPSILGQSVSLVSKSIGATLTTTGTTSDTLTIYGATSISQVTYGAGNAAAAVDIAAGNVYISATASNSVTIQHSATSGMIFNLIVLGAY